MACKSRPKRNFKDDLQKSLCLEMLWLVPISYIWGYGKTQGWREHLFPLPLSSDHSLALSLSLFLCPEEGIIIAQVGLFWLYLLHLPFQGLCYLWLPPWKFQFFFINSEVNIYASVVYFLNCPGPSWEEEWYCWGHLQGSNTLWRLWLPSPPTALHTFHGLSKRKQQCPQTSAV